MKERLRFLGRPALLLVIALVSLAVTLGALWVFGGNKQGGSAEPGTPIGRVGRWGSANRDRLTVCIDTVNVAAGERALAKTEAEAVLTGLATDPLWPQFNEGFPAPLVEEGCPSPPALYDPKAGPYQSESLFHVRGRVVSDASPFYLHVYVVPQEDIDRYGPWRFTTEEQFCSFDSCEGVTTGLYVSAKDLENHELFTGLIAKAIGLRGLSQ